MLPSDKGHHELSASHGIELKVFIVWGFRVSDIRAFNLIVLIHSQLAFVKLL